MCLLEEHSTFQLPFSPSSVSSSLQQLFPGYREFGAKKYFTDHGTANIVQLFAAVKGNVSRLLFF